MLTFHNKINHSHHSWAQMACTERHIILLLSILWIIKVVIETSLVASLESSQDLKSIVFVWQIWTTHVFGITPLLDLSIFFLGSIATQLASSVASHFQKKFCEIQTKSIFFNSTLWNKLYFQLFCSIGYNLKRTWNFR